ncbi:MAG TPA: ribosome-binding factor A, partial [Hyphomonas sp.]|nr:ribosome-binding factor A [Hyphomonas sp.]
MKHVQSPESKSVRLLKIGEQIRHVIAQVLQRGEVNDRNLSDMIVSVSEVRVSPDLR